MNGHSDPSRKTFYTAAAAAGLTAAFCFWIYDRRQRVYVLTKLCICFRMNRQLADLRENILALTKDSGMFTSTVTGDLQSPDPLETVMSVGDDGEAARVLFPGEKLIYLRPNHLSESFGKREFMTPLLRNLDELVAGEGFLGPSSICTQSIFRDVGEKSKVFYIFR